MADYSISVITLTKNRSRLLELCFKSLLNQLSKNDEIIVIDNNSTDNTQKIIRIYKDRLPIISYISKLKGYPRLYNLAIQKSSKTILAFLDDDCIAGKDFVRNIRKAHKEKKNVVYQGMTYSLPKGNIYAEIMGDHYQNWLTINQGNNNSFQVLDNKNVSLPKSIIKKVGLFNENLKAAEDIEWGIRMRKKRIPIILNKKIIAHHHERDNLVNFVKQHISIALSEGSLDSSLENEYKIGLIKPNKALLHLKSAFLREIKYLKELRLKDFLLLPALYLILTLIRIWGYRKNYQH